MAWPLTPLTTYVANSTPAIKAADLNALQKFDNDVMLANLSFRALKIDGTGGVDLSGAPPAAGSLSVSNGATIVAGGLTVTTGGILVSNNDIVTTIGSLISGYYLKSNTNASGTPAGAAPRTSTVPLGTSFGDGLIIGWAVVQGGANPTLIRGYNVYDVTGGTGNVTVTFNTSPANPTQGCAVASASTSNAVCNTSTNVSGGRIYANVLVTVENVANASNFAVVCWAT